MTLTFEEYQALGGVCDLTAFNRNIDRACSLIDKATFGRIDGMSEVPKAAKALCRDIVEYLQNSTTSMTVSSRSQSAGGVSESESYIAKTAQDVDSDIGALICGYLSNICDDYGTPLLYRGCMR